eukprot:4975528-Pyramimonas_sp.AAC.1
MLAAESPVPTEVAAPSRPPRWREGRREGPSLRIEKNAEARSAAAIILWTIDWSARWAFVKEP